MKNYLYSERMNLFEPNVYINFLMEIIGNPTKDDLLSAVKAAFAANEATTSRIVLDEKGDAYYERMSESGCKINVSNDNWNDIIRHNEKIQTSIDI